VCVCGVVGQAHGFVFGVIDFVHRHHVLPVSSVCNCALSAAVIALVSSQCAALVSLQ